MVAGLGFGGIPIQRCTEDEAMAVVNRCLDLGVNFIDTANAYATSEERIGRAISGRKRDDIVIATKTQHREGAKIDERLDLSLERLGTDYIDLYQFHQVGDSAGFEKVMAPVGPLTKLEQAKKKGRMGGNTENGIMPKDANFRRGTGDGDDTFKYGLAPEGGGFPGGIHYRRCSATPAI